jgi:hypothetical protein
VGRQKHPKFHVQENENMNSLFKNLILAIFITFAGFFVLLCIIGGIKTYTPVPLGDMWDGYIEFFIRVLDGDKKIWWSQHNEHRILISRLLFWTDITFFKGLSIFLLIVNYLLGGLISYSFFKILKKALPEKEDKITIYCFSLFICAITFSWIQRENYVWTFQSQFFLVFLLPLVALYCLYLSSLNENDQRSFLFSCIAGVASAGSMVSGVFILPIMVISSFILKMKKTRIIFLCILSALVYFLYFYDYRSIAYHASPINVLLHHPFDFLKFVLLYLGGPFYYLSSQKEYIGILAGLFLILSWCYFAYRSKNSRIFSLQLVLLAFIFYIGLSAASTGAGRLGISDATSSRYMTPALMAWSALLVLYALNLSKKARYLMKPILIIKLLFLSSWQLHAIGYSGLGASFEQMISALALQLQIKDRIQTDMVYANQRKVLPLAKTASENKLSIFGTPRFQELTHSLGKIQLNQPNNPCLGSIDEISPIEGEDAYVKVQG